MSEVTKLLDAIGHGDPRASADLLPLVYTELRKLAAAKLANEKPGQTLQATALVHEAYLRLVADRTAPGSAGGSRSDDACWNSRGHFFAAAAEAMRRILVEQARRKDRIRHGGQLQRIDLDSDVGVPALAGNGQSDLLALDEALDRLAAHDSAAAQVVKLRYFAGLTIEETALAMNLSVRTVNRHWSYARAWLYQQLK
jgi:RNA polymerase sigma factor (TIGR02999 family)